MVVLICAGGPDVVDDDRLRALSHEADYVIACDSGARHLMRAGVSPDVVVGDFDSLTPAEIDAVRATGAHVETHPADKDVTDLDLGIAAALERGATEVLVTGVGGGLPDHFAASLGSLARPLGATVRAEGRHWHAQVLHAQDSLCVAVDQVFSVIAVGEARVSIAGARWELIEHDLAPLDSLGVGNRTQESAATVTVSAGAVVVFVRTGLA